MTLGKSRSARHLLNRALNAAGAVHPTETHDYSEREAERNVGPNVHLEERICVPTRVRTE